MKGWRTLGENSSRGCRHLLPKQATGMQRAFDTLSMLMLPGIRWLGLGDGKRTVMAVGRTQWKRARWWLLGLLVAAGALVLVIGGYGFGWEWTGLSTLPKSNTMLPAKSVWDWLQLLIVPAALAGAAFWFNAQQGRTGRQIAHDQQQEAMLQEYLDRMAELLLEKHLSTSQKNDEIRQVARARTMTILRRLDKERKTVLLQFLIEAQLVGGGHNIIDLSGADLSSADLNEVDLRFVVLSGANLSGANLNLSWLNRAILVQAKLNKANLSVARLNGANLNVADLRGADLSHADLSSADLGRADLRFADLTGADLSGANLGAANLYGTRVSPEQLKGVISLTDATLPDGSVYHANPPAPGSAAEPPPP